MSTSHIVYTRGQRFESAHPRRVLLARVGKPGIYPRRTAVRKPSSATSSLLSRKVLVSSIERYDRGIRNREGLGSREDPIGKQVPGKLLSLPDPQARRQEPRRCGGIHARARRGEPDLLRSWGAHKGSKNRSSSRTMHHFCPSH